MARSDISALNLAAAAKQPYYPLEFVEIIIDPDDATKQLRLTNHWHNITTIGEFNNSTYTYTAAGELMGIGDIQDNLAMKDNSINMSLSGVPASLRAIILGNVLEGSEVNILRGYYDEDTGNIVDTPFHLWSGQISSFGINDSRKFDEEDTITITASCTSELDSLLDRVSGRNTSLAGFQEHTPNDMSMEFMESLVNFAPEFGKD